MRDIKKELKISTIKELKNIYNSEILWIINILAHIQIIFLSIYILYNLHLHINFWKNPSINMGLWPVFFHQLTLIKEHFTNMLL